MEMVVRAAVIFCLLWGVTRAVGRSTLGELSTFELVLFVTMGDLVQQGVTQQEYSVTAAALAVCTFAVLTVLVSWVNRRWARARPVTHGVPVVVVRHGEVDVDALRHERLSASDLMAAAREEGIRSFDDVDLAVLEAEGKISFFTRDASSSGAAERPSVG